MFDKMPNRICIQIFFASMVLRVLCIKYVCVCLCAVVEIVAFDSSPKILSRDFRAINKFNFDDICIGFNRMKCKSASLFFYTLLIFVLLLPLLLLYSIEERLSGT